MVRLTVVGGLVAILAACGGGGGSGGGGGGGGSNNRSPNASFTATPTSGQAPVAVSFDASASTDPDGSITSYAWNFGDGATATGATVSHTYSAGGAFTATLQVTDNRGATDSATRQINVQPPVGSVDVTVKDSTGLAIPGARAEAIVNGASRAANTGADGKVLLTEVIAGTGTLNVSRDQFVSRTIPISVTANQTAVYEVILQRVTRAAGGVLTTATIPGTVAADGRTVEFSVQVVVVDQNSSAITGLTQNSFTLANCTPDPAPSAPGPECVATSATNSSDADAAYTVVGPGTVSPPLPFEVIPGRQPPDPYAAALAFDQSQSIRDNDPTDARLFSAKEFLGKLGANDRVAMSAFADDGQTNAALIPIKPVTLYPQGAPIFFQQANVSQLLPIVDSLASLEGGATPLYDAVCKVADFIAANPPPAGTRKATVLFTDGRNQPGTGASTYDCNTLDAAVAGSEAAGVDVFSIGLSGNVDGLALGTLAAEGNGIFLFAEDVSQLITIYGSLGNLLSGSLQTYRLTYRIQTDVANTFQVGRRIRGTIAVQTGSTPVSLPFVVRIFQP
jgi:PKD repeat protein